MDKISQGDLETFKNLRLEMERVNNQIDKVTLLKEKLELQTQLFTYEVFTRYGLKPGVDSLDGVTGAINRVAQTEAGQVESVQTEAPQVEEVK